MFRRGKSRRFSTNRMGLLFIKDDDAMSEGMTE
jgi:hypothetical protein